MGAALSLTVLAAPQKTTFDKLPRNSQEFVQRFFAGETIREVELNNENSWDKYTVWFDNGNHICFQGGSGDCTEIVLKQGSIPTEVLPTKAATYLHAHYRNQEIQAMKQTKEGFRVGLSNGVWIDFDKQGDFIKGNK